ncbi:MAG: polysaccharide biosynthesis transport protein [Candidatus Sumerlaeota bacterium]|nr:polysaccharide biosynthesis transport protein [Candidatus Sumerlaeota bacterium]
MQPILLEAVPREAESGDDFAEVRRYIELLWHRRWFVLFFVVLFLMLGAFQIKRSALVYESVVQIKYDPKSAVVDFGESQSMMFPRDEINTAVEMLKSPAIATEVLRVLGPMKTTEQVKDESPLARIREFVSFVSEKVNNVLVSEQKSVDGEVVRQQRRINSLINSIDVRLRPETRIIEVKVRSSNKERAAQIANAYANEFIAYMERGQRQSSTYARGYVKDQIDKTKSELAKAEKELYQVSGKADLSVTDAERQIAIETLTTLTKQVETQRYEVDLLEAEAAAYRSPDSRMMLDMDNRLIQGLLERKSELLAEYAKLSAENDDTFLPLVRLKKELDGIEEQIRKATADYQELNEDKLEVARLKLAALENRLEAQRERVDALEKQLISLRIPQREIEATRQVLNSLLDQYKKIEVTDDARKSNVSVLGPASIPTKPISPNVSRILVIAGILGLLFGAGLVLSISILDRSVRDPRAVENSLSLPFLGVLPYLHAGEKGLIRGRGKRVHAPLAQNSKTPAAEAVRYVRTSIQYSSAGRSPQVIVITSCFPQEGKSTVSSNLASFFGERSERTLLIDADLKRPVVHREFQLAKVPGLSDVLTGQTTIDEAIVSSVRDNLDVLPAGRATPSSVSLLDSKAMTDLITQLRGRYSTILLDTCPAHGMADALVLSQKADGVILVVRPGKTQMEALVHTTKKLRSMEAKILGVVYNTMKRSNSGNDYGYGYGYGYGYSYGKDASKDESGEITKPALAGSTGRDK